MNSNTSERVQLKMVDIIIGNICSLLAMAADSISSSMKTSRGMLLMQALGQVIYGIGSILLKGYSAVAQNTVSIVRNLVAISKKQNKAVEWGLIIIGVVLGVVFNNRGIIGLLPVIGNLEYSIAIFKFKDNERALKISFAVSVVLFAIFNTYILNFVGVAANAVILITTIINIVKGSGKNKK